jgi:hypothetical protein
MSDYFAVEGFTGQYFACKRYGTMSVAACARNYEAAPQAVKTGRLDGCIACPLGAQHAGKPSCAMTAPPQASRRRVCVRCRRSGRESDSRLLGRMRLVRGHTICVSCYNREREVLHGHNAKGGMPRKWAGLHRPRVASVCDARTVVKRLDSPVVDRVEAALTLMREPGAIGVVFAALGLEPRS